MKGDEVENIENLIYEYNYYVNVKKEEFRYDFSCYESEHPFILH